MLRQAEFMGQDRVAEKGLPRKMTPVGTVGNMGQLFTVYEKNWICEDCSQENYASVKKCFRCRRNKPQNQQENYLESPALNVMQSGGQIVWKEAVDPQTYQIYYYNTQTGATQWERPEEMGPAPLATGLIRTILGCLLCKLSTYLL